MIAEARRAPDPEAALLALTVVDPAVGSGHFVVAAARRIAAALAAVRTGDAEPAPTDLHTATADVVARCVYGVDLNDLAIEITKVALWLEAFDAGRPLPFLDAHFKVGNALLGTTPALLAERVPTHAITALTGDDSGWTAKLKARNKTERGRDTGQYALDGNALAVGTTELTKRARVLDDPAVASLDEARERADAWRRFEADPDLEVRRLVADAWCAAFVQHKAPGAGPGITHDTVRRLAENPASVAPVVVDQVQALARQYRFFHWHLEFPTIFEVPEQGDDADPVTGWRGGFSCVVGNPPWERVKIQDKEFFAAAGRDDIVNAKTAAIRKVMIDELPDEDPALHEDYLAALRTSDGITHLLRSGGRYPLTRQGDVNTYSVFAETFRAILAPAGAAGIVTPTGLATDKTTAPFFADTLDTKRLLAFYDFENEAKIFPGVDHRVRFAVTAISGTQRLALRTRFAFLTRHLRDVPERRFELSPDEVVAMNPNSAHWNRDWLLGWRDIACASDMRTFVPSVLPTSATGNKFPLAFPETPAHGPLLHAVWSSLAFDFIARQKLSGTTMNFYVVKQLACPTPDTFDNPTPWQPDVTLRQWVLPYVRELSYTSWRLRPYAIETGDDGPPFRWDPQRRALLRADLDAAFLHVYGLTRAEAEHVLDSFFVLRKYELRDHGEFRTRRLVLDAYDRMTAAARGGPAWIPLADISAGEGPRHPAAAS